MNFGSSNDWNVTDFLFGGITNAANQSSRLQIDANQTGTTFGHLFFLFYSNGPDSRDQYFNKLVYTKR